MDRLCIYVGDQLAGHLSREGGQFAFAYLSDYSGPPVFLAWELSQKRRVWSEFPPAFDGLLPEGVLLDQLLAKHKLDKGDKWGQLLAVGLDLTGFISVLPEGAGKSPIGKVIPGETRHKRVPIKPPEEALPVNSAELVAYHAKNKLRMSLSGVQPKVSAIYSRTENRFKIVETNGSYILKPSPQAFPGAAENEALTMRLARSAGIEVPLCGWLEARDGAGVFWIERFDRWGAGNRNRIRCEDACQILEVPASWKYTGNLETLARMVKEYCSNPQLQLAKLFQRVLFCWITGNGDMHLKNWSLIENGPLIELAPAYDLLNTAVLLNDEEESALSLNDQKKGFDRKLLIDYFGHKVCALNDRMIQKTLNQLTSIGWTRVILMSKLSKDDGIKYGNLVQERLNALML
jgi:serine/threonine-protein kinase HipA